MVSTLERPVAVPARGRSARRLVPLTLVLVAALALSACGGKSAAQRATDELNAGLAAQQAGNLDEAVRHYQECLKQDPRNVACIYDLGLVSHLRGNAADAEANYRLALSIDPNYTPALFNLAILRTQQGGADEAISLYQRYIALKPDDAAGHLNLGLLLRAKGDTAGADQELATALRLDPSISVPQASATAST
jgi:tetratricopeptide (TPR) repeat protein